VTGVVVVAITRIPLHHPTVGLWNEQNLLVPIAWKDSTWTSARIFGKSKHKKQSSKNNNTTAKTTTTTTTATTTKPQKEQGLLTLILLRHVKSSWDDPTLNDFDRPLNKRGKRNAKDLGKWLPSHDDATPLPDRIIASPSLRTRQTLHYIRQWGWAKHVPVEYDQSLYDLAINEIMGYNEYIPYKIDSIHQQYPETPTNTVMIVGHNPAMAKFASNLVVLATNSSTTKPIIDENYFPTGTLCVLQWNTAPVDSPDSDWTTTLHQQPGQVVLFLTPSDISKK
jgi:phosphohistidine phosphatase